VSCGRSLTMERSSNHHNRVRCVVSLERRPIHVVVHSIPSSSDRRVFDVLVASDRAFCPERTRCGLDYRVPFWDDDLPVATRFLSVFGLIRVLLG